MTETTPHREPSVPTSAWSRFLVSAYRRTPAPLGRLVVRAVTPGYRVGVLAVLQRPDGKVLLVDQPYVEGWSLPGGDLKRGESVQTGLRRELREELGLDVEVPAPVLACQRVEDAWVTFVVRIELPDRQAAVATASSAEIRRLGWFDPEELPELHGDAAAPLNLALDR